VLTHSSTHSSLMGSLVDIVMLKERNVGFDISEGEEGGGQPKRRPSLFLHRSLSSQNGLFFNLRRFKKNDEWWDVFRSILGRFSIIFKTF
jgi:hypothetical protein